MRFVVQSVGPGDELELRQLLEVHRRLLSGTLLDKHAGVVRTEQNWIGGSRVTIPARPCSCRRLPSTCPTCSRTCAPSATRTPCRPSHRRRLPTRSSRRFIRSSTATAGPGAPSSTSSCAGAAWRRACSYRSRSSWRPGRGITSTGCTAFRYRGSGIRARRTSRDQPVGRPLRRGLHPRRRRRGGVRSADRPHRGGLAPALGLGPRGLSLRPAGARPSRRPSVHGHERRGAHRPQLHRRQRGDQRGCSTPAPSGRSAWDGATALSKRGRSSPPSPTSSGGWRAPSEIRASLHPRARFRPAPRRAEAPRPRESPPAPRSAETACPLLKTLAFP